MLHAGRAKIVLRWRKSFRFSVRALMLFVIVVAAALGWMVNEARIQRSAVQVIQRHGGGALYRWQFERGVPNAQARPWAPSWLVERLGVDYFGSVVFVSVGGPPNGHESQTAAVGRLGRLERLDLWKTTVTDAGLANVRSLSRLRFLDLSGSTVEDPALVHLKSLQRLELLNLNATGIGDAGLSYLKDLAGLRILYLGGTQITDEGLASLRNLQTLRALALTDTQVTDAGLARLTSLSNLSDLSLGDTSVSDAGLAYLTQLPKLERVSFTGNRHTGSLKVTREGQRSLQQAKPKLIIE